MVKCPNQSNLFIYEQVKDFVKKSGLKKGEFNGNNILKTTCEKKNKGQAHC